MSERAWQIGLMTNFLDCYSGIDWPSVFDGTYDAEHPEGRWFDPVKIWTRSYWEFVRRPADPTVLQEPALWDLFVIMFLAAGYSRDEVTDARLRRLATSFFTYLKDAAHEAFGTLPRDVFAQYRDLVHQEPAPSDQEVMAFPRYRTGSTVRPSSAGDDAEGPGSEEGWRT